MEEETTIIPAIDYYDIIAGKYDTEMGTAVKSTRAIVKKYVREIANTQSLLDFGAGTGQDLDWQLDEKYTITFYEPSGEMANKACKRFDLNTKKNVRTYIGANATYKNLLNDDVRYDMIFSNFGAINSIKNINTLFNVFSKVLDKKGHIIIVLYTKGKIWNKLKSLLLPSKIITSTIRYDSTSSTMVAYMHTYRQFVKAAKKNGFSLFNKQELTKSGFMLYHFVKRE